MKKRAPGQSKVVAIVAGGDIHRRQLLAIKKADVVIGVDRGAYWLVERGVPPDIAIGDFDSVTNVEKKRIHDESVVYIEHVPQKDMTDLELAIEEAIHMRATGVHIYGALGRRFDHTLAATQLLMRLESHNIYGIIVDNFNKIHIVRHQLTLPKTQKFRYVSIIPLHKNAKVSLTGFTYDVSHQTFMSSSTLGISNEIVAEFATIIVHSGQVLVIQSSDVPVR
jgi:thiamine pyrophosphokinase